MKLNDCGQTISILLNFSCPDPVEGKYSLSQSVAVRGSMLTVCANGGSMCKDIFVCEPAQSVNGRLKTCQSALRIAYLYAFTQAQ